MSRSAWAGRWPSTRPKASRPTVVTATRGERGRSGKAEPPTPEVVGDLREAELRAAAAELGVREVNLLGYPDKELDQADPDGSASAESSSHLRRREAARGV